MKNTVAHTKEDRIITSPKMMDYKTKMWSILKKL